MTPFRLLCDRCGLSRAEAAELLAVRPDTIKSWLDGRRSTPAGPIEALRNLYAAIERSVETAIATIDALSAEHGAPNEIEIGLSSDDFEARSLGLPCVGAHAAMLGILIARSSAVIRIVPRGSTVATAGAQTALSTPA